MYIRIYVYTYLYELASYIFLENYFTLKQKCFAGQFLWFRTNSFWSPCIRGGSRGMANTCV